MAGDARQPFADVGAPRRLTLVAAKVFKTGVVAKTYRPA
jgi:hypothetical protein